MLLLLGLLLISMSLFEQLFALTRLTSSTVANLFILNRFGHLLGWLVIVVTAT